MTSVLDANTVVMLVLLTVKTWASTLFYIIAIYYMITRLRKNNG